MYNYYLDSRQSKGQVWNSNKKCGVFKIIKL